MGNCDKPQVMNEEWAHEKDLSVLLKVCFSQYLLFKKLLEQLFLELYTVSVPLLFFLEMH